MIDGIGSSSLAGTHNPDPLEKRGVIIEQGEFPIDEVAQATALRNAMKVLNIGRDKIQFFLKTMAGIL